MELNTNSNSSSNSSRLKIPFDALEDHIQCSICLSPMRGSVLTPCGHRYCYKCISEWIGREHSCPCCKKQLTVKSFYFDVQFDNLVEQILLHRDQAEQNHFDQLFNDVTTANGSDQGTAASPFQDILRKHLKKSMISREQYYNKLQQDFRHKIHKLESGMTPEGLKGTGQSLEEIRDQLEKNLAESEKLAAEALDKYLSNNIPSLDFLPVTVSVYSNDKRIRLHDIVFNPCDTMTDIKVKIEESIRLKKDDEITAWVEEGGTILLINPLSKMDHYDIDDLLYSVATRDDISLLTWTSQPVLQNFMRPGSEIVLNGLFKLKADAPLQCYVQIFRERGAQPVDYYTCEDCNSNWICKSCMQGCHSGHRITTFVLKHTPSWGCCYCPKKKLCQIQSNG